METTADHTTAAPAPITTRSPRAIADEASATLQAANRAFVPANLVKLAELQIEFMGAVADRLEAAGLR